MGRFRQEQRDHRRREEQNTGIEQDLTMISDVRQKPKENRSESSHAPADIVTKAGAGRAEQSGKQRRQVHGEQRESALTKANQRKPVQEHGMIARHGVSSEHDKKIAQESKADSGAVANHPGHPSAKEITQNG